ncbi:glutathione transferase [Comamonadaceae bacterium OH2545_COT-014]|nr:glutathione transferase [Comamonadaceae bacterium OH2545_COT-014]
MTPKPKPPRPVFATPALTLYADRHCVSPYAMSVFVALTELGLPFALRTLDLAAGEQAGAGFAARSLTRRVPMLTEDDWALTESSAITEYLQDTRPGAALYPHNRRARAQARQVQAWLRSDLLPIRQERPAEGVFCPGRPPPAPLSAAAQQAADKLATAALHWLSDGREHLFGRWCLADTDLALMIQRLILAGDAVPGVLRCYAQRQWLRPSVQAWCTLPRP